MVAENLRELLPEFAQDRTFLSALAVCSGASLLALRWVKRRSIRRKTEEARKIKERELQEMEKAVQRFKKENPQGQTKSILSLSLVELTDKLQEGSISPESVLYTYMEKALEVNKEVNCLTDFLHECEAHVQEMKRKPDKGPLYGIPFSIKESIPCKGYDSCCGLLNQGVLEQEDGVIIQVLKKQGAIPFVKTNIPQALICYDCSNPIHGQTVNPLNHKKTPGGSSGGEAALISGGGSIIGLGSDTGGSVRFPSSFCGICALKPTAYRLSILGMRDPVDGPKGVPTVIGPLARDVDSLVLCMRALLCDDMFRLDPNVPPLHFNEEVFSSSAPLRVGYYDTYCHFPATPSMRRVVLETKKLLEAAGHTLVPFTPPHLDWNIMDLFTRLFFADGGSAFLEKFKGNLVDPHLQDAVTSCQIPFFIKKTMATLLKPWNPRMANSLNAMCQAQSVKDLWANQKIREDYCQTFIAEWRRLNLDVVLGPMLGPAFNIGFPGKLLAAACFTVQYNILNFPVGVVPVSSVTEDDERLLKDYMGYNNDKIDKLMKKAVEGGVGLPLSVQCVALPWQEELCLRFMKEVETLTAAKKNR